MLKKILFLSAATLVCLSFTAVAEEKPVTVDGPAAKAVVPGCPCSLRLVSSTEVVVEPAYVPVQAFRRGVRGFVPVDNIFVIEGAEIKTVGRSVKGVAPCGTSVDFQRTVAYKQTRLGFFHPVPVWTIVK
ncbi:MAG: hypothetical protein LBT89_06880 [Planctomycetaceae bacterium]|jgi:hypothetical protein|nr:hypothetical protein [Planctomycetaceae bacterium]